MAAVPYVGFDQTDWWKKREREFIKLNNEYIKLFYYLIGVSLSLPFGTILFVDSLSIPL